MPPVGYCTLKDVRRALREASLPGDVSQDKQLAVDAITAETEPLERNLSQHFYEPDGISEASEIDIPTAPKSRDDEHDIPTNGAMVHGAAERDRYRYRENSDALLESDPRSDRWRKDRYEPKREMRISIGEAEALEPPIDESRPAYVHIQLARDYTKSLSRLLVIGADGGYTDWVADDSYTGGVGLEHRGEDYWVRINSGGVSDMYLNAHAMDDDIGSLSNAVYVEFTHGHEGIPRAVRRAVALKAGAEFAEEAAVQIPDNATVYNVETKAEQMRTKAEDLLEEYQ